MQGKVVVITGASQGIGAATARIFADAGARVVLLARSTAAIDALATEIGRGALAITCDVADAGAIQTALGRVAVECGALDVLIGNAGVIDPIARIADAPAEAWSRAIDVNLKGVFYGMQAAIPLMRARGGTIITVSSGAAHNPLEGWSAYCAAKAGVAMLTASLDHEARASGIRAMGLSPGTVATQMQREIKSSGVNPVSRLDWSDHIPPDWPARTLLWMCSPDADDFIGTEISLRDDSIRRRVGLV